MRNCYIKKIKVNRQAEEMKSKKYDVCKCIYICYEHVLIKQNINNFLCN